MWVDNEGGMHTVALPKPSRLFDGDMAGQLALLTEADRAALAQFVDAQLEADADTAARRPMWGTGEVAHEPPLTLRIKVASLASRHDIEQAVAEIPFVWRADFVLALEDLLDEFT